MKIDEALNAKQAELDSIQADIDSLDNQAKGHYDSMKKYNELKTKAAVLKKEKKKKERDFNTVINFFKNADENYLTKIFPLFAEQKGDAV